MLPMDHSTEGPLSESDFMLPNLENQSIYDFHDDDERDEDCFNLSIDESPKRSKKSSGALKMKLPGKIFF